MAQREILPFGDPILRKVCRPVTEVNCRILALLDDLKDTLYARPGRAGLAAPQIGVLRRVLVMDCGDGLIELINPQLLEAEGEEDGMEGCLSYPGYYGRVKRYQYVKISSMDRNGETVTLEGENLLARCIQHEMDHLDGKLFIDHVTDSHLVHEATHQYVSLLDVIRLSNRQ
ncbi:peptide deformylase [Paenibacillus thiaminolyticus]|uniref:Peptide deformylase n=1 Tax=Paenibacillus thiaminolyticus TaxID=49283 RepID=A0AAP9DWY1_PANTH|nr:peptide deformylase [Paenibacillus thiaminolyticus]MCY9534037.1 peptide deformylase [Paenibacillus thiaminolyticus]MCY9603734.1 peptide deformylase [Paenibacillus thiaminolyticus]MCY9610347.1 peptide deformylase [Paenibacillus thiaminolyticus]MCY9614555.1 peptide deformylase [Paenibacillus thiaminolyticus]MCY9618916.1 peptide deformylase [Paenibacillus thiaminolyticus]